jgi:RNA polymerase sigma factor (sigma-70 family)
MIESVTTYYRTILHDNPHLPAERIQQLLEQQPPSKNAIDAVVLSCQRLILKLAVKIKRRFTHIPIMDLITESNIKLLNSIHKFDINRNVQFSTFISTVIYRHLRAFAESYEIWLSTSCDDTDTKSRPDAERTKAINRLGVIILKHLGERDAAILFDRYGMRGNTKTLAEIGENLHLTRERIRQIEYRALRRLRTIIQKELPQLTSDGQRYSSNGHTICRQTAVRPK